MVTVALAIGVIAGLVIFVIEGSLDLSLVIGISLFCGIVSSLITGSFMPYLFWRLHSDPAEASDPIATVVQDTLSVIIFFLVANALL